MLAWRSAILNTQCKLRSGLRASPGATAEAIVAGCLRLRSAEARVFWVV
jgi:hypothetical protein